VKIDGRICLGEDVLFDRIRTQSLILRGNCIMSKHPRNKSKGLRRLQKNDLKTKPADVMQKVREQARKAYSEAKESGKIGTILAEARRLALEATEYDPDIRKIYWFPHEEEVHLIEIDENTVASGTGHVEPFYFDSTATEPVPSGIAIIRPDEYGKLHMPEGWGDWDDGEELEIGTRS